MARFVYIWQFDVAPGKEAEFLRHYGPDGTWAALFRQDPDYIETLLLADRDTPLRYLTVDRWRRAEACAAFRTRCAQAYEDLDRACASLTRAETFIGHYDE